jgi:predicted acetyltransferase
MMLRLAEGEGMAELELVTDVDNVASQWVVERNGGFRVEEFLQPERLGGGRAVRWHIDLS